MTSFQSVVVVTIAAIMAIAAHAADTDNCGGGCVPGSAEFCGLDDQCHIYSCQSWYEFGRRNYTGYDGVSPTPLTCQDIQVTEAYDIDGIVYYPSVSFWCNSLTPSPIAMGFTRRCTTSGPNTDFTCYEMATETDFQPFLDEVSSSGLNCTDDKYDETGYPKFTYRVAYEYKINQNGISGLGSMVFAQGHNGTSEFNETLALNGTMYASYQESTLQPTAAPTPSPTSSPTLGTSSAFSKKKETIFTAGIVLGVTFIVSVCL